MPVIEGLDPSMQFYLSTAFLIAVGIFTAWSHVRGRAAPKQRSSEFAMAGQLADMGPVKELVEQTGLLVQQQVRTNMHLEAVATAIKEVAELYRAEMKAHASQEEVERLAQQLFERRLAEQRPPRRRPTRRKPPAT